MEYPWSIYGVSMEYLWSIYGVSMEYLWSIYGVSMELTSPEIAIQIIMTYKIKFYKSSKLRSSNVVKEKSDPFEAALNVFTTE